MGQPLLLLLLVFIDAIHGFVVSTARTRTFLRVTDTKEVEDFLEAKYPSFAKFMKSEELWKKIQKDSDDGITVFAANDDAFDELGDKRRSQLVDLRNSEPTEKMASYHFVNEPVTFDQLLNSGGIITFGGQLDVDQGTSGGFFGIGGTDDGSVSINHKAKIINSFPVGASIVHEVDHLVSPELLWRYCDQLRIPGSS